MSVRKMQRYTESDLQRIASAGMRGALSAQAATCATASVSECPSSAKQARGTTGRNDAPARNEEGFVMLPYPVGVNRVWRNFRGRMVANPVAETWKRTAANLARLAGITITGGPVQVHYKLHPKTNRDGGASKIRLDIDAPAKALLDALNGVAWMDDKQVIRLVGEVADPVAGGGLSVRVMT